MLPFGMPWRRWPKNWFLAKFEKSKPTEGVSATFVIVMCMVICDEESCTGDKRI